MVPAVGDINADGIGDVIIGSRLGKPNGTSSGSTYVLFGHGVSTTTPWPAIVDLTTALTTGAGVRFDGVPPMITPAWGSPRET